MLPGETISSGASRICPECKVTTVQGVHQSGAGFYVGTYCECGPYSRESEYFRNKFIAEKALASGDYKRK